MFGQINKITTVAGKRDEVVQFVMSGADKMPGCRSYIVAKDVNAADIVWVTEVWDSADMHAASMGIPEVKAAVAEAMPMIAGFETVATIIPGQSQTWKPDAYPSMSPYLISPDADALIRFAEGAFGGILLRRFDRPDGSLMHAEVRIDDSLLMIGGGATSARSVAPHIHLYVPDVQATFARAVAAGATVVRKPQRKDENDDLRGGVQDPSGTTWWLARNSRDGTDTLSCRAATGESGHAHDRPARRYRP